ncbi:conserved protein of unknown function [Rhodovastum atsumiense]|uniref:Uncharacterized protein n=1 Tax=Rhodovastum atsumiense TaxID=504468 RepID=A0A5M6ILV3_9PROT|nr:hypothetical protein [Rhodovastum atsumiense]KAA5609172.1 hypothetical protein F1189_25405 [Rhodovastum atsumiense]CAH2602846.1 conserved protein of unknown function [Rhodovastum atsumiense]
MHFPHLRKAAGVALLMVTAAAPNDAVCKENVAWPDTFVARLEALAVLQTLNADLLSHDSATLTLERWCRTHRLASPARIVAERVRDVEKTPDEEQRRLLNVADADTVRYRHVRLRCGDHILSEADNWYVPGRLTAEMNRRLETTDEAFGHVVQPLHFQRRTLSADLLWRPLPEGWDMAIPEGGQAPATLQIPGQILRHRAVLVLPDGMPFSQVVETYTAAILAFGPPPSR